MICVIQNVVSVRMGAMPEGFDSIFRQAAIFRCLSADDRGRLALCARLREFQKGEALFYEGDAADHLLTVVEGRVKVFKTTARGTDVILEIFGPGDPVGAVAVYEARAYPASAAALEPTVCLSVPRADFFHLLETHPTMARGLLVGLTHRLMELSSRLAEMSGGRIEARLARFFLKLASDMGQPRPNGQFIPMMLSRQELAEMMGTTIETTIRIMSRWGKDDIVVTEKDGFLVRNRSTLESVAVG